MHLSRENETKIVKITHSEKELLREKEEAENHEGKWESFQEFARENILFADDED